MVTRRRPALALKRGIDVAGAAAAVVLLSPALAWTALAVGFTMGRPIFFRQVRPGLHGEPFEIVKFRTMRPTKPGEIWYMTDEERITPLGRFLRSSSLDELPELWNVLRGEMSLVGPRPLLMEYLNTYTPDEARRNDMRPGFTSWAAVNGRHTLRFEERLRLDTWYVDHWNLLLDFRIMAMTVAQVLRRADTDAIQDLDEIGFRLPGANGTMPGAASAGDEDASPGPPNAGPPDGHD
jgi:sugar transferase EpsL